MANGQGSVQSGVHTSLWRREPTRVIGYSTALVVAVINLVVSFGVVVTDEQQGAITATLTAVMVLIAGLTEGIRTQVTSQAKVEVIKERAKVVVAQKSRQVEELEQEVTEMKEAAKPKKRTVKKAAGK